MFPFFRPSCMPPQSLSFQSSLLLCVVYCLYQFFCSLFILGSFESGCRRPAPSHLVLYCCYIYASAYTLKMLNIWLCVLMSVVCLLVFHSFVVLSSRQKTAVGRRTDLVFRHWQWPFTHLYIVPASTTATFLISIFNYFVRAYSLTVSYFASPCAIHSIILYIWFGHQFVHHFSLPNFILFVLWFDTKKLLNMGTFKL